MVPAVTVTALNCAASSLAPNASTTCIATLGAAVISPVTVSLSSSVSALTVPASVNVPVGAASTSFTAVAGAFSASQTASLSASVGSSSASATISLVASASQGPTAQFVITGSASELSGRSNGSVVTPSTAPVGMTGALMLNGKGSVNFPSTGGVYFGNCCANYDNAYYKFSGTPVAGLFGVSQGQISFTLTSRYTFAQRQSSAAAMRVAFDARDANRHQYFFLTQVSSGLLMFNYMVGGASQVYYVPKGTEDRLFGSGVSLSVQIQWDGATIKLYLNGSLVQTTPYTPAAATWSSASTLDLGAYENVPYGGYNSLDDAIANFTVASATSQVTPPPATLPAPPPATTTTSALLLIHGDATELSGLSNGSTVTPSTAPSGMTGALRQNGSGAVSFDAAGGVYFLNCCANYDNAYYNFTGAGVGAVFSQTQGKISFTLTSRYSFAQRQTSAAAMRAAFDARDAYGHQYYFLTSVSSGTLLFTYMVGGAPQLYYVPKGTEDQLFGQGVSLNISIQWDGSTAKMYFNGTLVQTTTYTPAAANWSAASIFDLGAYDYTPYGAYNSLDDMIRDFTVTPGN